MDCLKEVGFWAPPGPHAAAGDRPDPRQLVDEAWASGLAAGERDKLKWFLTRGAFVESHELAYSFCRFDGCREAQRSPRVMGACTLTDGVYCWPEGFWHYVAVHSVKPPSGFLAHVAARQDALRATRDEIGEELLLWDDMEKRPVAMPRGMKDWILENTTLGKH